MNLLKDQTEIKEKMEKLFQEIIKSTIKPISVSEEETFLLTLLLRSIEYQEKDKNGSFEFTRFISTIEEAISLLSTSFHEEAVKFLTDHLIDLLQSRMFQEIEEEIILDIIDFYIHEKEEQNHSEKIDEYEKIFNLLKENNEPLFLMHFLLQIDETNLDKDMI